MSITVTTNLGTGNSAADAALWSSLQANASNENQSAQTTAALVTSGSSGTTAGTNGGVNVTPVIASVQATLDSIMANPALNMSRVLTSPSFAALVSALDGSAGNVSGDTASGNGISTSYSNSIGTSGGNSSAGSSAFVPTDGQSYAHLLGELQSVLQTPTEGNAADGLLNGLGLNGAWLNRMGQTGTQLAVA